MANNVIVSGSTDRTLKVSNLFAADSEPQCNKCILGLERRERHLRAHIVWSHFHRALHAPSFN